MPDQGRYRAVNGPRHAVKFQPGDDLRAPHRSRAAQVADGGAAFWRRSPSEIDQDFPGWLVTAYRFEAGSGGWERHPACDEVLHLISGAMNVIIEQDRGQRVIDLRAGSTCVVPRGRWHRQVARESGDLLAVTFGKGTQHRPDVGPSDD
jgi:mannose-6-phosphate isomerase-like protein (cupin superfamily)